jgi:hypothetical protein
MDDLIFALVERFKPETNGLTVEELPAGVAYSKGDSHEIRLELDNQEIVLSCNGNTKRFEIGNRDYGTRILRQIRKAIKTLR